jgi:hypothetical protein
MESIVLTPIRDLFLPQMLFLLFASPLNAKPALPREASFPLALANEAAEAALGRCEKDGYRVSVAVIDRAGVLKVLLKGDGAGLT